MPQKTQIKCKFNQHSMFNDIFRTLYTMQLCKVEAISPYTYYVTFQPPLNFLWANNESNMLCNSDWENLRCKQTLTYGLRFLHLILSTCLSAILVFSAGRHFVESASRLVFFIKPPATSSDVQRRQATASDVATQLFFCYYKMRDANGILCVYCML